MDVGVVTQFISNVGFPIAACIVCFWYMDKQETRHKEETDKLADSINNNTAVMQELLRKLEKE
jgi:hypothetical protein